MSVNPPNRGSSGPPGACDCADTRDVSSNRQGRPDVAIKGRGSARDLPNRFAKAHTESADDGWFVAGEPAAPPHTQVTEERARSIVSRNESPDIPFDTSINPYRGCEHGCVYCYARPSHAYLDLSPGLDFETKLFAKTNTAEVLRATLAKPGYRVSPINLGANTDPYQPIERRYALSRGVLEVMLETKHPCTIITKNAMIERDLDLLVPLARENLVQCFLSITTLDNRVAAKMEPRASAPHRRLAAVRALHAAGVPVSVMIAPIIPAITDHEIEALLEAARDAGAHDCSYVLLRLPHEVKELFRDWLQLHFPERAVHVMSLVNQMRGGRDNDPNFGSRMRGEGVFADLIATRFRKARARLAFPGGRIELDRTQFVPPRPPRDASPQADLF